MTAEEGRCTATMLGEAEDGDVVYHCGLMASHIDEHVDQYGAARWSDAEHPPIPRAEPADPCLALRPDTQEQCVRRARHEGPHRLGTGSESEWNHLTWPGGAPGTERMPLLLEDPAPAPRMPFEPGDFVALHHNGDTVGVVLRSTGKAVVAVCAMPLDLAKPRADRDTNDYILVKFCVPNDSCTRLVPENPGAVGYAIVEPLRELEEVWVRAEVDSVEEDDIIVEVGHKNLARIHAENWATHLRRFSPKVGGQEPRNR